MDNCLEGVAEAEGEGQIMSNIFQFSSGYIQSFGSGGSCFKQ